MGYVCVTPKSVFNKTTALLRLLEQESPGGEVGTWGQEWCMGPPFPAALCGAPLGLELPLQRGLHGLLLSLRLCALGFEAPRRVPRTGSWQQKLPSLMHGDLLL